MKKRMPKHPLSIEAIESALGLLPSIALSSAQSGLILLGRDIRRRIFAMGSEGMTHKPSGKVVQAKNRFPPKEVLSMLSTAAGS
jgi:hypothetical protein